MTDPDSEMLADFAQCWCGSKRGGDSGDHGRVGTLDRVEETGHAAVTHDLFGSYKGWEYPEDREKYRQGPEDRIDALREAIEALPLYRDAGKTIVPYDGIRWASASGSGELDIRAVKDEATRAALDDPGLERGLESPRGSPLLPPAPRRDDAAGAPA